MPSLDNNNSNYSNNNVKDDAPTTPAKAKKVTKPTQPPGAPLKAPAGVRAAHLPRNKGGAARKLDPEFTLALWLL